MAKKMGGGGIKGHKLPPAKANVKGSKSGKR